MLIWYFSPLPPFSHPNTTPLPYYVHPFFSHLYSVVPWSTQLLSVITFFPPHSHHPPNLVTPLVPLSPLLVTVLLPPFPALFSLYWSPLCCPIEGVTSPPLILFFFFFFFTSTCCLTSLGFLSLCGCVVSLSVTTVLSSNSECLCV